MMHANSGHAPGPGQPAAEAGAYQQRADQTGAGSVGDAVDVGFSQPRLREHLLRQRQQLADMIPRGEFRNHAAIAGM